jgi:hypothetical protein
MSANETITFYDVPLVCGAAPSIGCGSRAKPLLIDLEQQIAIKEAWLNRTGTIMAIVWRGRARSEEAAKPVFERHEIQCTERRDDLQTNGSFRAACWCETKSPQGSSCCLATVTKYVQAVIADQGRATAAVPVHVSLVKDCCASPKRTDSPKSE